MKLNPFRSEKTNLRKVELRDELGNDLSEQEQKYLEEIERRLKADVARETPASKEAELKRQEWETLQRTFKPQAPLYGSKYHRSGDVQAVKEKPGEADNREPEPKSYQDDPRYREYYERLRRETSRPEPSKYDEEVKPTSLDELDKSGWKAKPQPPRERPPVAPVSRPATPPVAARARETVARPDSDAFAEAGVLFHFDDGSVAIYKDAVSGKDYALFYFLEHDGSLAPRGIFLEQYDKQKIGKLSPTLLAQMLERKRWDRDAVIFHLDEYDYASLIPVTAAGPTRGRDSSVTTGYDTGGRSSSSTTGGFRTPPERRPSTNPDLSDSRTGNTAGPGRRDALLERGRILRVNVGGKVWEAVYWTDDEIGAIVAHNTNKVWGLMHLDLGRFRDSLEYGEVLSYEELSDIEQSLATQQRTKR